MLIKVVTYNIHHGKDIFNNPSLDKILSLLKRVQADIINLQEVDNLRPDTNHQNQALFLAKNLGMRYLYAAVRNYAVGSYGNAILSKYSIVNSENIILEDEKDSRACLKAEIRINKQRITVFNTHLGLIQPIRYQHLAEIILPQIINLHNPALLTGDFNAPPERPEIQMLSQVLTDTFIKNSGTNVGTFPADKASARIDYIFTNQYLSPIDYYIIDSDGSDHLPVVAMLEA